MSNYLHHVPGRLRVRTRFLCGDSLARTRLLQKLDALEGVTSVRLNQKAGSVTVQYEPDAVQVEDILELMREQGCHGDAKLRPVSRARVEKTENFSRMVGKMALNVLVSKGVSYSITSLLGARI